MHRGVPTHPAAFDFARSHLPVFRDEPGIPFEPVVIHLLEKHGAAPGWLCRPDGNDVTVAGPSRRRPLVGGADSQAHLFQSAKGGNHYRSRFPPDQIGRKSAGIRRRVILVSASTIPATPWYDGSRIRISKVRDLPGPVSPEGASNHYVFLFGPGRFLQHFQRFFCRPLFGGFLIPKVGGPHKVGQEQDCSQRNSDDQRAGGSSV